MKQLRSVVRSLSVVGLSALAAVGLAEAALRLLAPLPKEYRVLLPGSRVFEPDGRYVHGIHGPARYIVNRHGIRGPDFGPDSEEYRVLLVGGSTTECGMLDEDENWGSIAARQVRRAVDGRSVWFGNVGRSGLTSRDHVVTVRYLLAQYPRIDLVIVLVGVNDLTAALRQGRDYRSPPSLNDPNIERLQVRNAFAQSPAGYREMLTGDATAVETPWYKKSRLYLLAKQARTGLQAQTVLRGISGALLGQWRTHRQMASSMIDSLPDLTIPLQDYRSSLRGIAAEAENRGADILFVTQPSLWKDPISPGEERTLWLGGTGAFQEEPGHAYYTVPVLARAMRRYNDVTLEVCAERRLACLDLAELLPRDTLMFYDDVHFTEAGAARVGTLIADHLRETRPALRRADHSFNRERPPHAISATISGMPSGR